MARSGRARPQKPLVQAFRVLAAAPAVDTSWLPVTVVPMRRLVGSPIRLAAVAPVYLGSTTVVVPDESWQGSAPVFLRLPRLTTLLPTAMVQSFDTSAQRESSTRPTFSMSVPYRMELLQYQTLVGPVSPLAAGAGVVGGPGRLPQAMGVPYKIELTQYQAVVGPVQLPDVTAPSIAWAPQLVTASRGQGGWGTAVASGLTPPGPI